jgi:peptidoglycan/LPS O-acetylase OafA/YrhL
LKFLDTSSAREPGLDLMRSIAILWVMLWHFHWALKLVIVNLVANYGWMGVDVFFVLSGYLIGSQLLRPYLNDSRPSLGGFYLRRAFRVLPAYLTVLLLYFAVPGFREAPGISPAWQFLTFTENFRIDYAHDQAFSHVWSLCVEEHFYLVLPLLVLFLMRKPSFAKALSVILGILAFGIIIRCWIYLHQLQPLLDAHDDLFALGYIEKIYFRTHTRLDGLLVGVTLATIKTFRPLWWQRALSDGYATLIAGLGLCAWAMWLFLDRLAFLGALAGFPLMALGLGLLLISCVSPSSPLSRVRGFGVVAALAYSLYLTHKEVVHLDRIFFPHYVDSGGWLALLIYFVSSFIVAAILYLAVEQPFLKLREKTSARKSRPAHQGAAAG